MQLLQRPQGQVVEGEIRLNLGSKAYDVTKAPDSVMQHLRGNYISMIFQEPMTALNPVFRIGDQVDEVLALHNEKGHDEAQIKARTIELLEMVGIANSEGVYKMFPHELSAGASIGGRSSVRITISGTAPLRRSCASATKRRAARRLKRMNASGTAGTAIS